MVLLALLKVQVCLVLRMLRAQVMVGGRNMFGGRHSRDCGRVLVIDVVGAWIVLDETGWTCG